MGENISVGVLVSWEKQNRVCMNRGGPRLDALLEANKAAGTNLFFFSLQDVNFMTQKICGTYLTGQGQWRRKIFPLPQVLYKRQAIAEPDEQRFTRLIKLLTRQGTVFLNYQFPLDKWKVYICLIQREDLQDKLPPTWLIEDRSQLLELTQSFPSLYLKACRGGRGKQVMRVDNLGKGEYVFTRYVNGLIRGRGGIETMIHEAVKFFGPRQFIAQKAIDLIQIRGASVDFRAEVQRCSAVLPQVAAIPVRIARENSPITTHSESMSLEKFFDTYPSFLAYSDFKERAEAFLLTVYTAMETCFGPCGELGIDFGLDQDGRLWFIEANAQSAKVSFSNSYTPSDVIESYVTLLEYGKARVIETGK